jgi:hypothetical protein
VESLRVSMEAQLPARHRPARTLKRRLTAVCARSTVVDSVVWLPYGDTLHVDPVRLRYMDMILGFAKCRLIAAIERFRVDKGGLPPHLEHVRGPTMPPACVNRYAWCLLRRARRVA